MRRSPGNGRRRLHAPTSPLTVGAGFHARPASVDGQLGFAAPTLHQPLSHGAMRRDSSPFRGAEAWAETCGACASVYHDAYTFVPLTSVRGGVPAAPRSRDCWATLGAPVRPDQPRPRHPRRTRLSSTAQLMRFRGRSPRTISYGRTDVVLHPRPGRRGSPPLRCIGDVSACKRRRPSSDARGVEDAAPYGGCELQVSAEP